MSATNHKKTPSRAVLTRQTTRGPLNVQEDPLSTSTTLSSRTASPMEQSQDLLSQQDLLYTKEASDAQDHKQKDLSFLLDSSAFHPLSFLDIPVALRKTLSRTVRNVADLNSSFQELDTLISEGGFLAAAQLAAIILTSGAVSPTDLQSIFRLISVRFSCLELGGQLNLAAQESKILEDISSDFYYTSTEALEADNNTSTRPIPQHIMPYALRLQAIRLQAIGFNDLKRGVTLLYDLGLEARENICSPHVSPMQRQIWQSRLESLNIHVVNALLDVGDLQCAARTIAQVEPKEPKTRDRWLMQQSLMMMRLGQVESAKVTIEKISNEWTEKSCLQAITMLLDGDIDAAVAKGASQVQETSDPTLQISLKQNLAVALLYTGRMSEALKILRDLVQQGHAYQPLTLNLCTIFELTSEKSVDKKLRLVEQVAMSQSARPFTNADFKL